MGDDQRGGSASGSFTQAHPAVDLGVAESALSTRWTIRQEMTFFSAGGVKIVKAPNPSGFPNKLNESKPLERGRVVWSKCLQLEHAATVSPEMQECQRNCRNGREVGNGNERS